MKRLLLVSLLLTSACTQVDAGYRGIKLVWGEVQEKPLPEGVYFYAPWSTTIEKMNVREIKLSEQTECFTRDNQSANVTYSVNFYPDPSKMSVIYKQFGMDWQEKIVHQRVLGALKDSVSKYVADEIVGKRDEVRTRAEKELKDYLISRDVIVTTLDLTNISFSNAYQQAVEAKSVAIQEALRVKNQTVQVEEQSKQSIIQAKAAAEAMRIKADAIAQNQKLIDWEKLQVERAAIEKWNGSVPSYMAGSQTPFIKLDAK